MIVQSVWGIVFFLSFFLLHSGLCLEYLPVFVWCAFTNHGFLIAGWWRPNRINAWLLGRKKKGRVCLCKERHLLPDKTATSAKGLLSPLINLTPLDSEITISTTRADLQGQDFTRSNPFVKCQRRYLWLLLWGRWFLRTTPFALSQSGFIAEATVPHALRNPLLPWPLTLIFGEQNYLWHLYPCSLSRLISSPHCIPLFTHGKQAQIKSLLECALLNAIPAIIMQFFKKSFFCHKTMHCKGFRGFDFHVIVWGELL